MHGFYPTRRDEDLDDEEWARVREAVVAQACLQSYCVLRLRFLRYCCDTLRAALVKSERRSSAI